MIRALLDFVAIFFKMSLQVIVSIADRIHFVRKVAILFEIR